MAPPTAQVLLARLKARGLAEVKGAGVVADVLVKTRPLSDRELADLEARLLAHARSSTLHLDAIEDYARAATCRRQRIVDHFEGPHAAPVVSPCGTCDVCRREAGPRPAGEVGGSYGPFGAFMRRLRGLISPPNGDPKGDPSGGRTAAAPSGRAA